MMNPNMNFGGLIPIAPLTATSAADISFPTGTYGRGVGMISLTESAFRLLDALMLLETIGTVQTLSTTTAANIATTVAGVKAWFNLFANWMDVGLIARDERYMPNNHGSWFVATYAHIAVWTQNATLMTNANYYIGNYTVNNTGVTLTYTTNEFPLVVTGQIPSFYTQFDSTAQQPLETVRGLAYHYEMFNIEALSLIAYSAARLGVTLGSSTFLSYVRPDINVGMYQVVAELYYKYQNKLFYSDDNTFDYSDLAHNFMLLSKFSELSSLNLATKANAIYVSYMSNNATSLQSDPTSAINLYN